MMQRNAISISTMAFVFIVLLTFVLIPRLVSCRKVHRCFIARKIKEYTTYKRPWQIKQFLCIADMVSGFNMNLSISRSNGQRTVGIFQVEIIYLLIFFFNFILIRFRFSFDLKRCYNKPYAFK